jgi:cytochrome b6-f complex iron-sulfur subunit
MVEHRREKVGDEGGPRRSFLGMVTSTLMSGGLVAGYGMFAAHAGRFLFPTAKTASSWQFVSTLDRLRPGESLPFETPSGAKIVVARQEPGDSADSFIALSSVCPHLGCTVYWESQNDRFFCPCHNGAFDASGVATEGPPAAANQQLKRFPLKVEDGLLYVEIPRDSLNGPREA